MLDQAAANALTRTVAPWTLLLPSSYHLMKWNDVALRQAVIWLSSKLNKSILKLREDDFLNNSLERYAYPPSGRVRVGLGLGLGSFALLTFSENNLFVI